MTEAFEKYAKAHPSKPVTFRVIGNCLRAIVKVTAEGFRELRSDDVALEARLSMLSNLYDARLLALEKGTKSVGGVSWAGVHEAGKSYRSGELVTKNGLWLCIAPTTEAPGADPTAWKLVVHRKLVPTTDER